MIAHGLKSGGMRVKSELSVKFIGDVHGRFNSFFNEVKKDDSDIVIQLGDFGIFSKFDVHYIAQKLNLEKKWFFIRGNHDNPKLCETFPNHLKSGYHKDLNLFVVNGAFSIDREWRTEGIDFWRNEEHSLDELYSLIDEYESVKPRYVIAHEVPDSIARITFPWYKDNRYPSRTRQAMDTMLEIHEPEIWIHGHWHKDSDISIGGTRFICLDELKCTKLELSQNTNS